MNILDTNHKSYKIHLDSINYTAKYSNYANYIYELNETILSKPNMTLLFSLDSMVFTNSFYNINNNNNTFYYSFFPNQTGPIIKFKIHNGNYSIDDLINYLNSNLSASGFNFSYDTKTLKVTIVNTSPFRIVGNNKFTINTVLGFPEEINDEFIYSFIISPNVFNLATNMALNVILEGVRLKNNVVKNFKHDNTLMHVPIMSSFGEVQAFQSTSNFKYEVDIDTLNLMQIKILNQDFQNVDFNGCNFYLCLTVEYVYKKEEKEIFDMFNENSIFSHSLKGTLLEREKNIILNKK